MHTYNSSEKSVLGMGIARGLQNSWNHISSNLVWEIGTETSVYTNTEMRKKYENSERVSEKEFFMSFISLGFSFLLLCLIYSLKIIFGT